MTRIKPTDRNTQLAAAAVAANRRRRARGWTQTAKSPPRIREKCRDCSCYQLNEIRPVRQ